MVLRQRNLSLLLQSCKASIRKIVAVSDAAAARTQSNLILLESSTQYSLPVASTSKAWLSDSLGHMQPPIRFFTVASVSCSRLCQGGPGLPLAPLSSAIVKATAGSGPSGFQSHSAAARLCSERGASTSWRCARSFSSRQAAGQQVQPGSQVRLNTTTKSLSSL